MSDPVLPRSSEGIERGLLDELRDYLRHKFDCGVYFCANHPQGLHECTCGLAALLARYTQGEK